MKNDIRDLQLVELEILIEIDRICRKHNIKYFLVAGTLLGAIRHKGFIPWDDDIDISMPIDDYLRFCKICKNELSKAYFLQNYQTDFSNRWFAKIRKNNTTCIEKGLETANIHQGIWVDIFPLIGVKDDAKWINNLNRRAAFVKSLLSKRYAQGDFVNLSKEKKLLRFLPVALVRYVSGCIYKTVFQNHTDYEYCYYLWGDSKIRVRFESDLFDELCEVEFEGKKFFAPAKWDEYLKLCYGDYMELPPIENRNGGSHTISIVDIERDYKHYVR